MSICGSIRLSLDILYFQGKRALYVSSGNWQCHLNSEHAGNLGFGRLVNRIETATWVLGCRRAVSPMFTVWIPEVSGGQSGARSKLNPPQPKLKRAELI